MSVERVCSPSGVSRGARFFWLALAIAGCGGVDSKDPPDAAVGEPDAEVERDAATLRDAAPERDAAGERDAAPDLDAGPDSFVPEHPPVTDGQAGDLVLGQPDFATVEVGAGATGLTSMNGIGASGDLLWVGDSGNDRVMQWGLADAVDGAAARRVVGQLTMDSHDPGPSDVLLGRVPQPNFIRLFGNRTTLLVSDPINARVLVWDRLPPADGAPASLVLGQAAFDVSEGHLGADGISGPAGIWTDGARLVVCDRDAHRVLLWNHFPLDNGAPADLVIGQASFETADHPDPPTASSLAYPSAVFFDGRRLFVVDAGNNRVLVWNEMPAEDGQAADYVIGQPDLQAGLPNVDGSASARPDGLRGPSAVVVAFGSLFVAESANSRVVVFTPVPEQSGASASAVLGQVDLVSNGPHPPAADTMLRPSGLTVVGQSLFVADRDWNRVVRYQLDP